MMSKNNVCTVMKHIFLCVFMAFFGSFSVHAEPTPEIAPAIETHPNELEVGGGFGPSPFVGYGMMTPVSLLNLYWKSGVLDPKNEPAIIEYIQTAACDQYQKKFKDDFAWPEMIKATRHYVMNYKKNFTTMFYVVQPIALGRYVPDEKKFQITESTQYRNVRRMFFADFQRMSALCPETSPPISAPMQAVVGLGSGFSLTSLPMEASFARQTISFIDDRLKGLEIKSEKQDRFAYVKFFYTIRGFDRLDNGSDLNSLLKGPTIQFTGTMDGYEVYADQGETFLMHRWVNPKKVK